MDGPAPLKVKLQVHCGPEIAIGPGKADLLDAIAANGSISAAAKAMGMSYRRAWQLVDVMNRCWSAPLVETVPGGGEARGARLSETGRRVLAQYRALQHSAEGHANHAFAAGLADALATVPRPSQS